MEMVFKRWKIQLSIQGWQGWTIPNIDECFTNIRFADDVLLYARSLEESNAMLDLLLHEFSKVGFELNSEKKTRS